MAKKTGNISFKNGTGQGEYIYTPEEDPSGDIIDANGPITFDYKKDSKVFGRSVSQIAEIARTWLITLQERQSILPPAAVIGRR